MAALSERNRRAQFQLLVVPVRTRSSGARSCGPVAVNTVIMPPRVAVIGAGVIGMSTAVLAQEKIPSLDITVISEKFSPHTTGDVSAGLWFPYCVKDTSPSDISRWSSKTYKHMLKLWKSVDAGDAGVCLLPKYELSNEPEGAEPELPDWSKVPVAYHTINETQACKLTASDKYTGGAHFITFTLEPSRYLPYLTKKFLLYGGKIQQRKVEKLDDLCEQFEVVINCSGIQAHHLVDDNLVAPVRGQVLRVKAPWMFTILGEQAEDGNYIIPNMDAVILGGTHQQDDWNTNPDPKDSKAILEGCHRLIPGLKGAEIVSDRAGLRPVRAKVRIERDSIRDRNGNILEVIHNYGHGGSGVTLSWGCAHDAVEILQEILTSSLPTGIYKSKL